jgi:phage shock protein A
MGYRIRAVPAAATARKRLELQIQQLEQAAAVSGELKDLRRLYAITQAQEQRAVAASQRLQMKVDEFRTRKEAAKSSALARLSGLISASCSPCGRPIPPCCLAAALNATG